MEKLSEKKYWDSIYAKIGKQAKDKKATFLLKIKNWLKYITRDYSNYVLVETYSRYLPKSPNFKMIEVGCAPGKYLLFFNHYFGYQPFGVEYSEEGVQITRKYFLDNGLDPANIIHADFFDDGFLQSNKQKYDLVYSRGFIEHFENVKTVIDRHLSILKKDGYLIISIPNLNGLNGLILKRANPISYNTHNLSIMDKEKFTELFKNSGLHILFSDYIGFFSFGLFNTDNKFKHYLWRISLILQRPFDFIWRLFFGTIHLKSEYTSPYLLFIGKKR